MSYTSNNNVKIFMSFVECNILFSDYCLQNTVLKAFSIHHLNVSNLSPMRGIVLLAYFKKGNRNLGSVIWSYRTYLFIYSCPHSKYIDWKANPWATWKQELCLPTLQSFLSVVLAKSKWMPFSKKECLMLFRGKALDDFLKHRIFTGAGSV